MLANVNGDLLALVMMSIHQDPLNQIVAILIASNVDERNTRSIWTLSSDDSQVAIQELESTNLETLLDNLGSKLINAVVVGIGQDVIDDTTLVRGRAVLAQVLDTPVTELTMSDEIDVRDDFFDGRALLFFNAVLKDVLDDKTAGLTKGNLMPHATKGLIDFDHDLRRLASPAKLEQLLPNMASITVDNGVRDASKKLSNHIGLVVFRN